MAGRRRAATVQQPCLGCYCPPKKAGATSCGGGGAKKTTKKDKPPRRQRLNHLPPCGARSVRAIGRASPAPACLPSPRSPGKLSQTSRSSTWKDIFLGKKRESKIEESLSGVVLGRIESITTRFANSFAKSLLHTSSVIFSLLFEGWCCRPPQRGQNSDFRHRKRTRNKHAWNFLARRCRTRPRSTRSPDEWR